MSERANRRTFGCLVVLLLLLTVTSSCKRQEPPPAQAKVPIGYLALTINLPFFVALERGYFAEQGIQVEPVKFESTAELFNAVVAGRLNLTAVGGIAGVYPIEIQSKGLLKMYWFNANSGDKFVDYLVVRKDSTIRSWNDLRQKRLGIFPGTTSEMGARLILAHFNLVAGKDVEMVQIPPQIHLQALESQRVDALMTLEPTGTIAVAQGIGKIIDEGPNMKYLLDPFPGGAAVMRTDWVRANPDLARKIKAAFDKAIDFVRQSPEEAKKVLPKYTPLPADIAARTRVCLYWKVEDADRSAIQKFADLLTAEKILSDSVETGPMFLSEPDFRR